MRLTNDLSDYRGVRLSADRSAFVAARTDEANGIWIGERTGHRGAEVDTSEAPPVTLPGVGSQIAWAGDRLLYVARSGGRLGLWAIGPERTPQELVRNADSPAATSDGHTILYVSREPSTEASLWRVDADGRGAVRVETDAVWPVLTPDGRDVVFAKSTGGLTLWRRDLTSGESSQLAARARLPAVSGNGRSVAFLSLGDDGQNIVVVCALPSCASQRRLKPPGLPLGDSTVRWTPDGGGIAYVNASSGPNIWVQPLDGAAPRPMTQFTDGLSIGSFAWSPDGARLAIARGRTSTNVVLFSGMWPRGREPDGS